MKKIITIITIILILCLCISVTSCKTKPVDNEIAQPNIENDTVASSTTDETEQQVETKEEITEVQSSEETYENEEIIKEEQVDNTQSLTEQLDEEEKSQPLSDGILHESYEIIIPSLKECVQNSTDIFTGKIISAQELKELPSSYGFDLNTSIAVLYTVEIQQNLKSHITTKGGVINVLHFTSPLQKHYDGTETWANGYEIGKQYLIGGRVQPYKENPIILDYSQLTASISEDGTVVPESGVAKKNFEGISTLPEFVAHKDTDGLWENKQTDTAQRFRDIIPTDGKEELTEQQIIDYLKEAINIDSDKVLLVTDDIK